MIIAPQWYERFELHGLLVASNAGWHGAGISRGKLDDLVTAGELIRVRRGAYATRAILEQAALEPALEHAVKATAVRVTGKHEESVVSYESAALLHGMDLLGDPPGTQPAEKVALTVPPGTRTGRHTAPGVDVHSAEVPPEHKEERFFRVPVTTAARTVVDIARTSTFMQGVVVTDSALRQGIATASAIGRVLADCAQWPGVEKARRVAAFATHLSESALESCARVIFYQRELPPPVLQAPIRGRDGTLIARPGFCWPQYRTLAEAGGLGHHDGAGLRELGWEDIHFTWSDLFGTPDSLLGRLHEAFGRSARNPKTQA